MNTSVVIYSVQCNKINLVMRRKKQDSYSDSNDTGSDHLILAHRGLVFSGKEFWGVVIAVLQVNNHGGSWRIVSWVIEIPCQQLQVRVMINLSKGISRCFIMVCLVVENVDIFKNPNYCISRIFSKMKLIGKLLICVTLILPL